MGSRSIRAGINWLVFGAFCRGGPETVMDLLDRIGVERLIDGRLRAAGSSPMSGMIWGIDTDGNIVSHKKRAQRDVEAGSWVHRPVDRDYAIVAATSDRWIS